MLNSWNILSALKVTFFLLKYSMTFVILVLHSYSAQESIYLIIRRHFFNVLFSSQKAKYFFHPWSKYKNLLTSASVGLSCSDYTVVVT
jgi:hypothetical protein